MQPKNPAVSVKEGWIPVRVFNCLNKPCKTYRCRGIGDLYPLVGEEESFEEISVCGLQGGEVGLENNH